MPVRSRSRAPAHTGTSCSSTRSGASRTISSHISSSSLRRTWPCWREGGWVRPMALVEEAEEELLALRDRYAETMAARDRMRYEREFSKAAERRLPSLVVRRIYQRAMDPDLDE